MQPNRMESILQIAAISNMSILVTGKQGNRQGGRNNRPRPAPARKATTRAWDIPAIQCNEPEDGVFFAQIGPTGGEQGYPAITGW